MKLSLILLTYNEATGTRAILPVLKPDNIDEVIAIDGGSSDGTLECFAEHDIPVFVQDKPGRGEAFRLAFEKAQGDSLIFFSPDGNEDPADLVKFRAPLEEGADLVIATRMTREAENEEDHQIFRWRKWANQAFTLLANIFWNRGPYVTDTINGYRAISRRAWELITPDGDGYTIEYQSTIRAFKHKLKIIEFPTREGQRLDDKEGSPSITTGLAFLRLFLRELFSR
jgi:glycosyltransferase involved in cell wall biosynthesis